MMIPNNAMMRGLSAAGRSVFLLQGSKFSVSTNSKTLLGLQRLATAPQFQILQSSNLKTCAPVSAFVKNEIQKWGWEYLNGQKAMQRPLSPHLTVYRPQLTWMVSGLFRVTGMVMGSAVLVAATTLMVAPFDFTQALDFVKGLGIPSMLFIPVKFAVAWPIIFHYLNGIRFIGFDLAKGTDVASVYRSGFLVIYLSILLATVCALWPQIEAAIKPKATSASAASE